MSGAPEVRIAEDAQELAQEAADLFVWLGQQAVAASGRFRVVLSGGTTPKLLYAMLVSPAFSGQLEWPRVEFYFGDERCVPPDHPESNFRMADETLLRPLKIAPERIFRMRGEADDPDEAAREYETVRVPAKLIRPVSGRVIWILDRAAASGLTVAKQGVVSHEE